MFESLSDRLEGVFKKLKGRGLLKEEDVEAALKEIRMALLEADVNFKVVKEFIATVQEKAVGTEVVQSISPGQQVIKVVHDELVNLLGGESVALDFTGKGPAVILMVGLQGSGKTTTSGKLAKLLIKQGRRPYLVPADVYRPAAIKQLTVLGESLDVPVHPSTTEQNPVTIAQNAMLVAEKSGYDTLILDTAGRLARA